MRIGTLDWDCSMAYMGHRASVLISWGVCGVSVNDCGGVEGLIGTDGWTGR